MNASSAPAVAGLRRLWLVVALLIAAMVTHIAANLLAPSGFGGALTWQRPPLVSLLSLGSDLTIFMEAAREMAAGRDPLQLNYNSPPLTAAFFMPFAMLPPDVAYETHFILIIVENALVLALLAALLLRALPEGTPLDTMTQTALLVGCLVVSAAFQFLGYPMEFALERGNYDSSALLASMIGIWWSLKPSRPLWGPVICLSIAVHLKVYPVLLLFLPLWQHRWRSLLPLALVNLTFLYCFGEDRGTSFLTGLYHYSMRAYFWVGNHSGASFNAEVFRPFLGRFLPASLVGAAAFAFTIGLSLVLWLWGLSRLWRCAYDVRSVLLAVALTYPVTSAAIAVSNDYKLVVVIVPLTICLTHFAFRYHAAAQRRHLLGLLATLACFVLIARSPLLSPVLGIQNKFPLVLFVEILCVLVVLDRDPFAARAETAVAS